MSLSTLGRCIQTLKSKKGDIPPFRESTLTLLLKNSLAGNCKTCLIVTIADDSSMLSESQSTLRFGIECGHIKTSTEKVSFDVENTTKKLNEKYQ